MEKRYTSVAVEDWFLDLVDVELFAVLSIILLLDILLLLADILLEFEGVVEFWLILDEFEFEFSIFPVCGDVTGDIALFSSSGFALDALRTLSNLCMIFFNIFGQLCTTTQITTNRFASCKENWQSTRQRR